MVNDQNYTDDDDDDDDDGESNELLLRSWYNTDEQQHTLLSQGVGLEYDEKKNGNGTGQQVIDNKSYFLSDRIEYSS